MMFCRYCGRTEVSLADLLWRTPSPFRWRERASCGAEGRWDLKNSWNTLIFAHMGSCNCCTVPKCVEAFQPGGISIYIAGMVDARCARTGGVVVEGGGWVEYG